MINRILERLEALKEDAYDKWDGGASYSAYIKAISIVQEVAKEYEPCYKDCAECEAYDKVKHNCPKFCKAITETLKEYESGGWIPCSERFPEYMEEVLVWHSDQNMHCVAWYNPSTKIWYSNDFATEDSKYIVAWCELPAPYQKGE